MEMFYVQGKTSNGVPQSDRLFFVLICRCNKTKFVF